MENLIQFEKFFPWLRLIAATPGGRRISFNDAKRVKVVSYDEFSLCIVRVCHAIHVCRRIDGALGCLPLLLLRTVESCCSFVRILFFHEFAACGEVLLQICEKKLLSEGF